MKRKKMMYKKESCHIISSSDYDPGSLYYYFESHIYPTEGNRISKEFTPNWNSSQKVV